MSWDEAVQKCRGKTILVPHGSTEEHGYHLPLKTDALIAEKACAVFYPSKNVVVAPVMNYTGHKTTKSIPGTTGPNKEEYEKWLETVVADMLKLRPGKIIIFFAHDGNTQKEIFSRLSKRFRKLAAVFSTKVYKKAGKKS